jgi:hypothetical protein
VNDIAQSRDKIPVAIGALMIASAGPRSRVKAALAHALNEPWQCGKHIALDQEREQQIFDWI